MLENTEWAINNGQSRETGRDTINVREYRMGNQQWTIQRNWQRYKNVREYRMGNQQWTIQRNWQRYNKC
jgi:hypothetical protein